MHSCCDSSASGPGVYSEAMPSSGPQQGPQGPRLPPYPGQSSMFPPRGAAPSNLQTPGMESTRLPFQHGMGFNQGKSMA